MFILAKKHTLFQSLSDILKASGYTVAMENILIILMLYISLELFEVQWQKGDTLMAVLSNLYRYYRKNIFLFFLMHPTFYIGIGLAMVTELSFGAVALVFIKSIDIATKIILIQQIFEKREVTVELSTMLLSPLHPVMMYLSVAVYTPLVYFALTAHSYSF